MLFTDAFAQTATDAAAQASGPASIAANLMPLLLIFVVFYFLLIRPQQKKMKEHQSMLDAVRRGDKVLTGGGIVGTVTKVDPDDFLQVEISPNVKVRVTKSSIATVLNRAGSVDADTLVANDN